MCNIFLQVALRKCPAQVALRKLLCACLQGPLLNQILCKLLFARYPAQGKCLCASALFKVLWASLHIAFYESSVQVPFCAGRNVPPERTLRTTFVLTSCDLEGTSRPAFVLAGALGTVFRVILLYSEVATFMRTQWGSNRDRAIARAVSQATMQLPRNSSQTAKEANDARGQGHSESDSTSTLAEG